MRSRGPFELPKMLRGAPINFLWSGTPIRPRPRKIEPGYQYRLQARIVFLTLAFLAMSVPSSGDGQNISRDGSPAAEPDLVALTKQTAEALSRGDYPASYTLAQKALALAEAELQPEHPNTLAAVHNLAVTSYALGRYEEAEPLFLRLVGARTRTLGRHHLDTLSSVNLLAALYTQQGRYSDAEPLLLQALETNTGSLARNHPVRLALMHGLATLYQHQGRYAEAEPFYRGAIDAYERKLGRDNEYTLNSVHALATLYSLLGRYSEAEMLHLRVHAAYEHTLGGEHPNTLQALNNLAALYHHQGRYAEAEPIQIRVLEARKRTLGKDHPATHNALDNLGATYQFLRRFAEAEPLHRRSLEARQRTLGNGHPHTLISLSNLGSLHYLQARFADAEPYHRRASELSQQALGAIHPMTINSTAMLAMARLKAASPGDSALSPARFVVSGLRSRRTTGAGDFNPPPGEKGKTSIGFYYSLLADAAWVSAQKAPRDRTSLTVEAFTALQDATIGSTDRAVARMAVRHAAGESTSGLGALVRERDALQDQWDSNSSQYNELLARIDAGQFESQNRRLRVERSRIEARFAEIDTRLRSDFPQYFALIRPGALDLPSAQKMLSPEEAILLVVPTEFGTHVIGVSHNSITWSRSGWTDRQVNEAVRRLLWDVGASVTVAPHESAAWERQGGSGFPYDRKTAYALYRQIVAPAESVLRGKRHVFITAAGSLTSFPFGIMVTEEPQGMDGDAQALRKTSWFADAHALVQIPSIQSLQLLRSFGESQHRSGSRPSTFVGFGDPVLQGRAIQRGRGPRLEGKAASVVFSGNRTSSGASHVDINQIRRLNRLPGTATELENMRRALDAPAGSLFLAERATEARLRTMDLTNTNILALATHGLMAGELRGASEPGLVFTPPQRGSEDNDGFLTASEVSGLRLNADWVILSACNTASGDGSQGAPGLSGLARAFFYAGARNLLVSHWPVRDEVAARLTVRTLTLVQENPSLSRTEALQRAMREIREDQSHDGQDDTWAHPSVWAPFILVGDGTR